MNERKLFYGEIKEFKDYFRKNEFYMGVRELIIKIDFSSKWSLQNCHVLWFYLGMHGNRRKSLLKKEFLSFKGKNRVLYNRNILERKRGNKI